MFSITSAFSLTFHSRNHSNIPKKHYLSILQTVVLLNIFVETVIYLFQGFFGEVKQNLFEIEFETT